MTDFPYPTNKSNTGRLLLRASEGFDAKVLVRLASAGFEEATTGHVNTLRHVDMQGRRISSLADDAGVTKQAMGQMVRGLEHHGWVESRPSPTDGRVKLVVLTDAGVALCDTVRAAVAEIEQNFVNFLGRERYDAMRAALEALAAERTPID